ncbi:MAG: hypothetical protein ACRDRO_01600 [Pseudonocardiaceae bacterium]
MPAVLAYCGLQATLAVWALIWHPDATRTIPLAALRHAVSEGEVNT